MQFSLSTLPVLLLATASSAMVSNYTNIPSTKIGMLLFPAFQALDVFGPLDVLNLLSFSRHLELSLIAPTLEPVSTRPSMINPYNSSFSESIVPTHTLADAPQLDVLIVPGGIGTRASVAELQPHIDFIAATYPKLQHLISVCTGAGLVAQSGVLDGRRATTNKKAWTETVALGPQTNWVGHARWVVDGNVYTSSGVSAGIDATLAWVEEVFGIEIADELANDIEHERIRDPNDDPFADVWGVEDMPAVGSHGTEVVHPTGVMPTGSYATGVYPTGVYPTEVHATGPRPTTEVENEAEGVHAPEAVVRRSWSWTA